MNEYVRDVTGEDFTAKDFRTWVGTVLAARALQQLKEFTSNAQAKRNVLSAVEAVAGMLGNTRSVCRKSYIHPAVIDLYMDRMLAQSLAACAGERYCLGASRLSRTETAVLTLLRRRLRREPHRKSA